MSARVDTPTSRRISSALIISPGLPSTPGTVVAWHSDRTTEMRQRMPFESLLAPDDTHDERGVPCAGVFS